MKRIWGEYKRDIIFVLILILMILFHLQTVKNLKKDEQNLIDAFRSGQFQDFRERKQEWFNE